VEEGHQEEEGHRLPHEAQIGVLPRRGVQEELPRGEEHRVEAAACHHPEEIHSKGQEVPRGEGERHKGEHRQEVPRGAAGHRGEGEDLAGEGEDHQGEGHHPGEGEEDYHFHHQNSHLLTELTRQRGRKKRTYDVTPLERDFFFSSEFLYNNTHAH